MTCTQKTVVVLGAAYGGARAAKVIANGIPKGWRVIVIDRNTHANHAYVLPRLSVLPGHEHKAFIPLHNVFQLPPGTTHDNLILNAHVKAITPKTISLSRAFPEHGIHTTSLNYEYAIYALGSRLPDPLNLWGGPFEGTKPESVEWLKAQQKVIEAAGSVLVCGGGALGIQFATDIKAVHPNKSVTLLHSRDRLLPKFDQEMHLEVLREMKATGIETILGERLDIESARHQPPKTNTKGQKVVKTLSGREIAADLVMLCTGQCPQTSFLKTMDPDTVNPDDNLARVLKTMQLTTYPRERRGADTNCVATALENLNVSKTQNAPSLTYHNIFVVGDAADAFDAIKAGHTACYQADVAASNVLRLIRGEGKTLEEYTPGLPSIKVTLGMTKAVNQSNGVVGVKNDGAEDVRAATMWPYFGMEVKDEKELYA